MALSFNEQLDTGTLIVDALNLAFRWKHQGRTDFRYEYEKTVQSLANSYKCKDVIITADGGSSSYRKNILPSYKQNRKDKYATQTEEEQIAFEEFFEEYQATLDMLNSYLTVLRFDGVEADDIAAYLVKFKDKFKFEDAELGGYQTDLLKNLLGVLDDDLSLTLSRFGDKAVALKAKNGSVSVDYVLSDLSVIADPPALKKLPDFQTKIKLNKNFIDLSLIHI